MSITPSSSEIAIWEGVIHSDRGDLPIEVARYLLGLSFGCNSNISRLHSAL